MGHYIGPFEVLVAKGATKINQLVQKVGTNVVAFDSPIMQKELTFTGEGTVGHNIDMHVTTDHHASSAMTTLGPIAADKAGADNLNALVAAIHTNMSGMGLNHTDITVASNKITLTVASSILVVSFTESGLETVPTVAIPTANVPASLGTHTITFEGVPQIGDYYTLAYVFHFSEYATDNSLTSLLTKFKGWLVSFFSNITVSGNQMIFTAKAGDPLPAIGPTLSIRQNSRATLPAATVQATTTSTITIINATSLVKGNTITINDGTSDHRIIYMDDQDETVDTELERLKAKVDAAHTATYTSATKTITIAAADTFEFTVTMGDDATIN